MKASALISLLGKMIGEHGDLEVYPDSEGPGFFTHLYPLEKVYTGKRKDYPYDGEPFKVFEITTGVGH